MSPTVALQPFQPAHLEILAVWLRQPHVARWFPEPEANLAWAKNPPAGASQAIIVWDGVDVGYVRWQHVDRRTLDALGLPEIPANSVDVDILLGSEGSVGKGLGPAALTVVADQIRRDPTVALMGLTTSIANTRAHRAFEKAGFSIARQYDPNGRGLCHLMLRDLRRERAADTRDVPADVVAFFDDFVEAFTSFNGARVAARYLVPGVALRGDGSIHCLQSRAEIDQFFQAALESYYRDGCRGIRFRDLEAVPMGSRSVLGTVTWELLRDDGSVLRHWSQSYNLVRVGTGWQILASTYHTA